MASSRISIRLAVLTVCLLAVLAGCKSTDKGKKEEVKAEEPKRVEKNLDISEAPTNIVFEEPVEVEGRWD